MKPLACVCVLVAVGALSGCLSDNAEPASPAAAGPEACHPGWMNVFTEAVDAFQAGGVSGSKAYPLAYNASRTRFDFWAEIPAVQASVVVEVTDAVGAVLFTHSFETGNNIGFPSGGRAFGKTVEGPSAPMGDVHFRWETDGLIEGLHLTMDAEACPDALETVSNLER